MGLINLSREVLASELGYHLMCVGTPTGCSCGSALPLTGALLIPESEGNVFVLLEPCLLLGWHPAFVGLLSISLASDPLALLPF